MKNLMSDRCAAQKKFNDIFIKYRHSVLPDIINNWNDLSDSDKKSFSTVNVFYCGLHFLVALADQAEESLKIWEGLMFKDGKVGTLAHGGYSNGESGTTRLKRAVCNSVQTQG